MKLEFKDPQGMSNIDIQNLENEIGLKFLSGLKSFLKENSGASEPLLGGTYFIPIIYENGWEDEMFISKIETVESIKNTLSYKKGLDELVKHFELTETYIETRYLLPFIELSGGEAYIALAGSNEGSVYIVDNGDFGVIKMSRTLDEFLNLIEVDLEK